MWHIYTMTADRVLHAFNCAGVQVCYELHSSAVERCVIESDPTRCHRLGTFEARAVCWIIDDRADLDNSVETENCPRNLIGDLTCLM